MISPFGGRAHRAPAVGRLARACARGRGGAEASRRRLCGARHCVTRCIGGAAARQLAAADRRSPLSGRARSAGRSAAAARFVRSGLTPSLSTTPASTPPAPIDATRPLSGGSLAQAIRNAASTDARAPRPPSRACNACSAHRVADRQRIAAPAIAGQHQPLVAHHRIGPSRRGEPTRTPSPCRRASHPSLRSQSPIVLAGSTPVRSPSFCAASWPPGRCARAAPAASTTASSRLALASAPAALLHPHAFVPYRASTCSQSAAVPTQRSSLITASLAPAHSHPFILHTLLPPLLPLPSHLLHSRSSRRPP